MSGGEIPGLPPSVKNPDITSSRGHELSGHVRTHAYNLLYAWAEWVCVGCIANKLLITTT